jgi:imidazole glycerol phosphate synthase glutamine amidotransferase subunit
MKIEILDLGINNLKSVVSAFQENLTVSDSLTVISELSESLDPNLLVLPGLGSFDAGMQEVVKRNFDKLIKQSLNDGVRLVGICLGMQLLGTYSEESKGVKGLNVIPGTSNKLVKQHKENIPNMGWASTIPKLNNNFSALSKEKDFYFVHSYAFEPDDLTNILCTTVYGETQFVSGVISPNACGFQFHPEKSAKIGAQLVSEIIDWSKYEI